MLSVRPLLPVHADQVLRINRAAQPNVAPLDHVELARLVALSDSHIVATEENAVLAYALCFERDDAYDAEEFLTLRALISQPFVYVDQVAVVGSAQSMGIGRLLYRAIEHAGWESGARCLCCEVNTVPPNPGSLAFHGRLGFSKLSSFSTRDGRDVVLVRKSIAVGA